MGKSSALIRQKVKIFIENRCGTFYRGGKFIISNGKSIIQFLQELQKRNLNLKLVLDYPQVFSAESIKMDDIKLKKCILTRLKLKSFFLNILKVQDFV